MIDLDEGTIRALRALCTADAEHPESSVQHRFTRTREILDSATPGDAANFDSGRFRALELIDEKNRLTDAARRIADEAGWQPPPTVA